MSVRALAGALVLGIGLAGCSEPITPPDAGRPDATTANDAAMAVQDAATSACSGDSLQPCTVPHGSGLQTRQCVGGAWSDWGSCIPQRCDDDYVIGGSDCVLSGCSGAATQTCTIVHGAGSQSRTCTAGAWSSWGACTVVSCDSGYQQDGDACVATSCTGSATQACTIAHGTGSQSRTCTAGAWSSWGTCTVVSCDSGYQQDGDACLATSCTGSATQACTIAHGTGSQSRTCTAGAWSSWGTCAVVSCDPGYVQSTTQCEGGTYYVSPTGNDASAGDIAHPFQSFEKAYSVATAGNLILFRAGVYHPKDPTKPVTVMHGRHGTAAQPIRFWGAPGESVVFDFSTMQDFAGTDSAVGIDFTGDYWHWKNIAIVGVPQYVGHYMTVGFVARSCHHCVFEQMSFHDIFGTGFTFSGAADDNLALNCDAYNNQDPIDAYENSNGFMSVTSAGTTNTFRGCRAWYNCDDGFDHFGGDGMVVHEDCWAFWNGYVPGTTTAAGNGMGFKFGGSTTQQGVLTRKAHHCLAFGNLEWGFDQNNLLEPIEMLNCTSHKNSKGINLYQKGQAHTIRNCVSFANTGGYDHWITAASTDDHNSWNSSGVTVDASDFLSVDWTGVDGPRRPDGSLPELDYLKLAAGSDLIDKGADVGLPFQGAAPDLGCYERQ
ncbi:MAG: hypothetical protein QM765_26590 [Myxococcales bacterium]